MNKLKSFFKLPRIAMMSMLLFSSGLLQAQTENATFWTQETIFYAVVGMVFLVALLVLLVAINVLQLLKAFVKKDLTEEQLAASEAEPGWFAQLWAKWNDFKPMEKEEEILLDHNYDGIQELDNHLPPWWKGLFYVTIVYAVVYIMVFHVFKTSPLQEEQYELEVARAEEAAALRASNQVSVFDDSNLVYEANSSYISSGKQIFESQCGTCHAANGGGGAGPNLTDDYWLHGGKFQDIYNTVKNGIPGTTMIQWSMILSPEKVRDVATYVRSIRGTNPPGGKGPQGELFVPEETTEATEEGTDLD